MLKNYFKTAFNNLLRNKAYTLLHILGLGVGMAVFLLIAQYVKFEHSYEDFVPDRQNTYRVSLETYLNNDLTAASAENYPAVGPALQREFPEVTAFARLYNLGYKNNVVITNEDAKPIPIAIKVHRFLYADSAFLPMMGYRLLEGDAATALAQPFTAVVSETYARMYFGSGDPIGKTLHMHDDDFNDELVKVTGVFKDAPPNTHLKFDVLFSYKTLSNRGNTTACLYCKPSRSHAGASASFYNRFELSWTRDDMYTFIRLRPGTDAKLIETRMPAIIAKYKPELAASGKRQELHLQPLKDIHLTSDLAEEPEANGNGGVVFYLGVIGILVLLIAWINYVNLSTARSLSRAKEVGVRKVAGASRSQLIVQFLTEALLVNLFSLLVASLLVDVSLPYFNHLSGLALDASYLVRPWFLTLLAALWVIGTLISGSYPALVLSWFKPVTVLKGKFKSSSGGILLRKSLVIAQFVASIALIAGTIIVYRQLYYMMNQNIGMNISQVVVMDRPGIAPDDEDNLNAFRGGIDLFRNELKKSPSVEGVTNCETVPGKQRVYKVTLKKYGDNSNDSITVRFNSIDDDFINVFKMQLLAGRNFSRSYVKDADTSVIITASTARLLGYKRPGDAIGKTLVADFNNWKPIVVGVVNDYHQLSLKKPLEPTLFACDFYESDYFAIRVQTGHLDQTLEHVRQAWTEAFPGNPFEYFFLDEYFNRQYANEQQFGGLFTTFAFFTILISCLGLFGLSAYTASQRVKEVGIRKVLGASVSGIATMLSRDFLKLVVLSVFIATPITWLVMNRWLGSFAYRTNIQWWIFVLAGLAALLIALVTVSFQAIRAATANPIKSLRTE
jgi:putative ABC transport system permease protein